jgi:prepilin-type N-terminal cleavage/methylation domain-containing protein
MRDIDRQRGFSLIDVLAVIALFSVIVAMTIPITGGALTGHRLKGDAQGVKNLVALAKMRASSRFTRARVMVNLSTNTYVLQVWDRTANVWASEGTASRTTTGVTFGVGGLTTPPPDTQIVIALSPECTDGVDATAAILPDTACIIFNSRGLPVDRDGTLFPRHALYLTGEAGVYATTVTATPLIRSWRSPSNAPTWTEI